MIEFASFFIILLTALIFSQVFGRLHVPWIIALIVGGIIIGPYGFKIITPDATLEFFKNLGLVFLMFMAGLHIRFSGMKLVWKESFIIAGVSGSISFLTGLGMGILLGYGIAISILLGVIFISSSVAVLIPFLEKRGLLHARIGQTTISAVMIQDIVSLVLLAIALQYLFETSSLPLPIYVVLLIITLFVVGVIKWGIPRLKKVFSSPRDKGKDVFERDVRLVFAVLIGMVIISEAMGLHSIIGAFFAGIILSESITGTSLKEKIHVLAYGIFIPIFFVVLGTQTDPLIFIKEREGLVLLGAIVMASMISKFIGGWFSSRMAGFSSSQSAFIGTCGIPKLSTTLAVVAVGHHYDVIEDSLITAFIFLTVITTFVGPFLSGYIFRRVKKEKIIGDLKMYFSPDVAKSFAKHEQNERNFKVATVVDTVLIKEINEMKPPLHVAELGGGAHPDRYHNLFNNLLENNGRIDWVDVSPHMIELAKKYISVPEYRKRKKVIFFKNREITDYLYRLKDEALDVIIMKYVLDHMESLDELFTLISSKIKKTGVFIATVNTDSKLRSFSTNARYFYKGEDVPENETKILRDGDSYTIKFFKESGNPSSGYIEGADTVKYFHSKAEIEKLAKTHGLSVFLGDWKEFLDENKKEEDLNIDQELLILKKD